MSDSNTINPVRTVIHTTPQPKIYTRDDFARDLKKVSKKASAPKK